VTRVVARLQELVHPREGPVRGEEYRLWGGDGGARQPETSVVLEAFRRGWPFVCETVPTRVKRGAEAFLRCGDVRYGFVEVSRESSTHAR
jgi:hypothetical protein